MCWSRPQKNRLIYLFARYPALMAFSLEPVRTEETERVHVAAKRLVWAPKNRFLVTDCLDCRVRPTTLGPELPPGWQGPREPDLTHVVLQILTLMDRAKPTLLLVQNAHRELSLLIDLVRKVMPYTWGTFLFTDILDLQTVLRDRLARPEDLNHVLTYYGLCNPARKTRKEWDPAERVIALTQQLLAERTDLLDYVNLIGVPEGSKIQGTPIPDFTYLVQEPHSKRCGREARLPVKYRNSLG